MVILNYQTSSLPFLDGSPTLFIPQLHHLQWQSITNLHLAPVPMPAPDYLYLIPPWLVTIPCPFRQHPVCNLYPHCLVHPGVQDKRRVSEIDLSQPRHKTAFWWRHNGPVTSQLTDPIKWRNYPLQLNGIFVHINTHKNEYLTHRCRRSTNEQLCLIFLYIPIWFES